MRGLKWLLGALVALATIGALYQIAGMVFDRKEHSAPGQLIDIGGHRLHLYCIGQGSPTVVLEAAAPGWSLYWSLVQPEVARRPGSAPMIAPASDGATAAPYRAQGNGWCMNSIACSIAQESPVPMCW